MDRADQAEPAASLRDALSGDGDRESGDGGQAGSQNDSQRGTGAGSRHVAPTISPEEAACAVTLVDARGHRCPMPLLMAKRGLNGVAPGERVRVLSTDAGSLKDFETFSRQSGHRLLSVETAGDEYHLLLERAPASG